MIEERVDLEVVNLLQELEVTVAELLCFFEEGKDFDFRVYPEWTAKDILGHLLFWQESFARNLDNLVTGKSPSPLKGRLGDLNQQGVEEFRQVSLNQLIARFRSAQESISKTITKPDIGYIPYRKGSRDYLPKEHLQVVNDHIRKHLRDLQKAGNRTGYNMGVV
jgi:hypothetical protein